MRRLVIVAAGVLVVAACDQRVDRARVALVRTATSIVGTTSAVAPPAAPAPSATATAMATTTARPASSAPGAAGDDLVDCTPRPDLPPRRLSPIETRDTLGPLSRSILHAIQTRNYRAFASYVHPVKGLRAQMSEPIPRVEVARLAFDTRPLVQWSEYEAMSLRSYLVGFIIMFDGPYSLQKDSRRDWLAPRPVGYSDHCVDSADIGPDWGLPYIYYGTAYSDADAGLKMTVGMSFDGHVDDRWYLVQIMTWEEYPPREVAEHWEQGTQARELFASRAARRSASDGRPLTCDGW